MGYAFIRRTLGECSHQYSTSYTLSSSHKICTGTATCTLCGNVITETVTGEWTKWRDATCTEPASYDYRYTWTNSVFSGKVYCCDGHESGSALGHNLTYTQGTDNDHKAVCSRCDYDSGWVDCARITSDSEACNGVTCSCGRVVYGSGHIASNNVTSYDSTTHTFSCTRCGQSNAVTKSHSYAGGTPTYTYNYNDNCYSIKCDGCNYIKYVAHNFVNGKCTQCGVY